MMNVRDENWYLVFVIDKMFMWLSVLGQVGDRPFTDIVYGNRNGFLTVLTEPLSRAEEPFIVRQVGFCLLFLYISL